MKILKRFLASVLNVFVKLLPHANDPPRDSRGSASPPSSRRRDPMQSPWRIYRLYAVDSHLLLRGETGRVISIGAYAGVAPLMRYNLDSGAKRGPCSSLSLLLADASEQLSASKLERALAQSTEYVIAPADLDRSTHLDVSLLL